MFAIIAMHSIYQKHPGIETAGVQNLQFVLTQVLKFGTIGFFLISGFLLGERLDKAAPWGYLRRRVQRVGWPWAFWAGMSAAGLVAVDFVCRQNTSLPLYVQLWNKTDQMVFGSIYWFVPNMLFALAILLAFRWQLDNLYFGLLLGLGSLFYGLNAYLNWIPSDHKIALFGFVFYLWLGNWATRHIQPILRWLQRTPLCALILLNLALCGLALAEGYYLAATTRGDPENTLRVTNQLYSISVVLTLIKMRPTWPSFVNVRTDTFGLYLIHPVLLKATQPLLAFLGCAVSRYALGGPMVLWSYRWMSPVVWVVTFAICYGVSLLACKAIARVPRFSWIIGQPQTETKYEVLVDGDSTFAEPRYVTMTA